MWYSQFSPPPLMLTAMLLGALASAIPNAAYAGDRAVADIIALSQTEPQAMQMLDTLSNRFGGRMTGSDAYTHAATWAKNQLSSWGLQAELEVAGQMPLGFNRGPWFGRVVPDLSDGNAVTNVEQSLRFATPAYSAGTRGVQTGKLVLGPKTLAEAELRRKEFESAWILIAGESNGAGRDGEYVYKTSAITRKLMAAGALGTLQSASEPLRAASSAPTNWDQLPTLPDIKLAATQYKMLKERVQNGEKIQLEFDIRNWFYPGPVVYHNVIATLPGSDPAAGSILLGAHLDSFDGGTGAADNGAGITTVMEAMRLLAKAGIKPRRNIVMLGFAGEELGLKGALAYTAKHAGELDHVVMMINRDSAPGAITGIRIPSTWQAPFERVSQNLQGLHPLFDFEAVIDDRPRHSNKAMRGNGGSDDAAFTLSRVATPRLLIRGDFDYQQVHHTVLDTYEKVLPFSGAQQYSALVLALIAYEVANATEDLKVDNYYLKTAKPEQ